VENAREPLEQASSVEGPENEITYLQRDPDGNQTDEKQQGSGTIWNHSRDD